MGKAGFVLRYAYLSQRGYYPEDLEKGNQDSFKIVPNFNGNPEHFLMAVFDGHGKEGDYCSYYVRDQIEDVLIDEMSARSDDFTLAYKETFPRINAGLRKSPIDDSLSGTTAISAFFN